jgi:hypothetical protein
MLGSAVNVRGRKRLRLLQQLGTWEPSQHLLEDRKTKKTCVEMAGRRTFRMHTDY